MKNFENIIHLKNFLVFLFFITLNVYGQAGSFQAFDPYSVAPDAITTKGGLLTSDGTNQVVKLACADTEIIEFDSLVTEGFKCVAKPVDTDTNAGTLCAPGEYLDGDGTCKAIPSGGGAPTLFQYVNPSTINTTSTTLAVIPGMTFSITATGNPIQISCSRCASRSTSTGVYERSIYRDTTLLHRDYGTGTSGGMTLIYVDNPPIGTYTYTAQWRAVTSGQATFVPETATFSILVY